MIPAAGVMLGKIGIDLSFHLWSVVLYRRWTGDTRSNSLGHAFAAALAEPFSFQLFRHLGAALGWFVFPHRPPQLGHQKPVQRDRTLGRRMIRGPGASTIGFACTTFPKNARARSISTL